MPNAKAAIKTEQTERLKRNEEKWSSAVMKAGFTVFPYIILERQDAFGLDPIDVNILIQLARHWWYSDNPAHPSKATIARCIGISTSTVRRHIARMEGEGLIRREKRYTERKSGGQDTNAYHFDGLIKKATPYAEEYIQLREQQRAEEEERRRRKKPKLVVNNTAPAAKPTQV
jgi:DNA-binding Lrp family transcriptional regulator